MAFNTSARDIQESVANLSREEKRRGYPAQFKAHAVAYLEEQQRLGVSEQQIAYDLRVCVPTLRRWALQNAHSSFSFVALDSLPSPVAPTSSSSSSKGFLVSGPAGLRIEGLQLSELIELLRSLSC